MKSSLHRTASFLITLLALACHGLTPVPVSAADGALAKGWQKSEWGSTPEQVAAAMPDARPLKDVAIVTLRGEALAAKLGIQPYEVAGIPYEVKFLFNRKGKLTAVTMTYAAEKVAAGQVFTELLKLLITRYGGFSGATSSGQGQSWTSNDNLVQTSLADEGQDRQRITVTYLAPIAAEASKL